MKFKTEFKNLHNIHKCFDSFFLSFNETFSRRLRNKFCSFSSLIFSKVVKVLFRFYNNKYIAVRLFFKALFCCCASNNFQHKTSGKIRLKLLHSQLVGRKALLLGIWAGVQQRYGRESSRVAPVE